MTLVLVGFPHLIMGKMLVNSVRLKGQGRNWGFNASSFKSFPNSFLKVADTSPSEVEGREEGRKEERKEGKKEERKGGREGKHREAPISFSLHSFAPLESPLSTCQPTCRHTIQQRPHSLKPFQHASSFPQLSSRSCKYYSLGIYITLLLCLSDKVGQPKFREPNSVAVSRGINR